MERFRLNINRPLGPRIKLVYLRKHKQPYVVQHASRSCSLNLGVQIGDSLTELVRLILVQKRRAFQPLMAAEVEGPEKHLTLQGLRCRLSNLSQLRGFVCLYSHPVASIDEEVPECHRSFPVRQDILQAVSLALVGKDRTSAACPELPPVEAWGKEDLFPICQVQRSQVSLWKAWKLMLGLKLEERVV